MNLLKNILENLYEQRSIRYLQNDPLSFCHRYTDPLDQEIVGLLAASFAYGKVSSIMCSVEKILSAMVPTPRSFIESYDPRAELSVLHGFKHRFNDCRDLRALFLALRTMFVEAGSVGAYFIRTYDEKTEDMTKSINEFCSAVLRMDYSSVFGVSGIPQDSYFPFFFPSPSSGSACKRLCMFLRWMVRPSNGIDLGLWKEITPAKLIIPVDAHIQRISRFLGFTARRNADWRMAREITTALKAFDPADPVKYDFSLCHIGISEGCTGNPGKACRFCVLSDFCEVSRL
ncbi:MAG TPA: TIGR02757 family protein [Geobacteraceae bacterium]|nr:TIGR02757 family protein [Geobacteraceae bacterium]